MVTKYSLKLSAKGLKVIYKSLIPKMEDGLINIRKAGLADLEAVVQLSANTFIESWKESEEEKDINTYVKENFNAERVLSELNDESIIYLFAEINGHPVGYIKLQQNCQPEGHELVRPIAIHRLYVEKEKQGLKIGSLLISKAKSIAAEEKYNFLWLGVWNRNYGALRLYERMGFTVFGEYKFIMGASVSDDYLMKCKIMNFA